MFWSTGVIGGQLTVLLYFTVLWIRSGSAPFHVTGSGSGLASRVQGMPIRMCINSKHMYFLYFFQKISICCRKCLKSWRLCLLRERKNIGNWQTVNKSTFFSLLSNMCKILGWIRMWFGIILVRIRIWIASNRHQIDADPQYRYNSMHFWPPFCREHRKLR